MVILAQDSFNRANSTTTLGNAETGQPWQAYVSSDTLRWGIQSNQAYPNLISYDSPTFIDVGQSDNLAYQLTHATYHVTSQIMWRITGNNDYFFIEGEGVFRFLNGDFSQLGSLPLIKTGDVIRIEMEGSQHTILVNGVEGFSFTDSNHLNGTRFGFSTNSTTTRYDNFLVETLIEPDITPPNEVSNLTEQHTHNSVTLEWVNPLDEDFSHVRILRDDNEILDEYTDTEYVDLDLSEDTNYTYTIKTVDDTGNESFGVSLSVKTGIEDANPPIPSIIQVSKRKISDEIGMDSAILSFQFNEDITHWKVNVNGVSHDTGVMADEGVGLIPSETEIQALIEWVDLYQEGRNRINVYGKDTNGNWTPYSIGELVDGGAFINIIFTRTIDSGVFGEFETGQRFDGGEWTI